jgi:hypothetical protein
MIGHQEGAIRTARLAEGKAGRAEVKKLAAPDHRRRVKRIDVTKERAEGAH